eukprot:TRINITY_DN3044_c0_g1_i3.p1 TRINITY_DN3044_c0_g1~~TRINITY_DN3044_c0_g1_i3.p1  ORF type:complete len:561 (-),score=120.55 TRINITY_DN3044_c0_g1_i3:111-1793(-)
MVSNELRQKRRPIKLLWTLTVVVIFVGYGFFSNFFTPTNNGNLLILNAGDNDNGGEAACHDPDLSGNACAYVNREDCLEIMELVPFLQYYYCQFGQMRVVGMILIILILVFFFGLLSSTAENYFCPSLDKLSIAMKLSEATAGSTLLALGNGAPDVFSIIAGTSDEGAELAIGGALGSGLFISCLVMGAVCMVSKVQLDPFPFMRDAITYLVATVLMFFILPKQSIDFTESVAFLVFYFTYVMSVVVIQVFSTKKDDKKDPGKDYYLIGVGPDEEKETLEEKSEVDESEAPDWKTMGLFAHAFASIQWKEKSLLDKFFYMFEAPFTLARNMTVPCVEEESFIPLLAVFQPICAIEFMFVITSTGSLTLFGLPIRLICYCFAVPLTIWMVIEIRKKQFPRPAWLFGTLSFCLSIAWMYIMATVVIDLIQTVGIIMDFSPLLLGLIVLAAGNSVADLVANLVFASRGQASMAVAACYAGPLLNTLLGMGLSFALRNAGGQLIVFTFDKTMQIAFISLIIVLLVAVVIIPFFKFKAGKSFGFINIGLYIIFLVLVLFADNKVI